MLGRQSLHTDAAGIRAVFEEFRIPFEERDPQRLVDEGNGYSEPLLKHMGFDRIESIDFSDYEHPTHVHDFNRPISPEFDAGYDMVLDGGSLEHIFNFPVALRNCMRMVKPGGIFVTNTPCNNNCGHGFYQFSPELYFSMMRANNGFKLVDIFCHESGHDMKWHRVKDPDVIKNRVHLFTRKPAMMLVIARRLAGAELPEFQVQQSDYQTLWAGESLKVPFEQDRPLKFGSLVRRFLAKSISGNLKSRIRDLLEPDRFKPEFFSPADTNKGSLLESALSARNLPRE
jgi:SAM-dependent methyltransferase